MLFFGCLIFFIIKADCFPQPWFQHDNDINSYQEHRKYVHPVYYGELESAHSRTRRLDFVDHYQHYFRPQRKNDVVRPAHYGAFQFTTMPPSSHPHLLIIKKNERVDRIKHRANDEMYVATNEYPAVVPSISDLLSNGYGLNRYGYFNKDARTIQANDYMDLNQVEMFLRTRRHENPAKVEEITTIEIPTTTTPPQVLTTVAGPVKPESLQNIINELKRALAFIQTHSVEEIKKEPITQNTPTEELIKYITSSVETLRKTKDTGLRSVLIKDISIALEIILSRIVRSTNELMKSNSTIAEHYKQEHITKQDLMMKILHKLQQGANRDVEILDLQLEKKNVSKSEKLIDEDNGGEVNSGEVEYRFTTPKFGLQDDSINAIDGNINRDAEKFTQKPVELTTTSLKEGVPARQEESSEEGGGNFVANLLSSFLGSLSNAEGGVDVDAVVGLVSGLSVQREDGTYDFSGLTETLQSFLAPDEDGGGGSDVGSFLGGLVGAILQGSAQPPGPAGVGKLTGNVVAYLLPGLSGPAPSSNEEEGNRKTGLDSGSFLAGLLSSMLGASSSSSSSSNPSAKPSGGDQQPGGDKLEGSVGFFTMIKNGLLKSIFSIITSLVMTSAGASSSSSAGLSSSSSSKGH